jgi:hypothetical protein
VSGHARPRWRLLPVVVDPVGMVCAWTWGLGSVAVTGMLGYLVAEEHGHASVPAWSAPASVPDAVSDSSSGEGGSDA